MGWGRRRGGLKDLMLLSDGGGGGGGGGEWKSGWTVVVEVEVGDWERRDGCLEGGRLGVKRLGLLAGYKLEWIEEE